jgi:subtilisin family serine protease
MRKPLALASAGLIGLMAAAGPGPTSAQSTRPVIAAETDVPSTRFPMPVAPSELLNTPTLLTDVLPPLRAEAERLLRDYDIQDPTIATTLRVGLASIAWLQDRPEETLRLVAEQRAAETKPQLQQVGQMTREALAVGSLAPEAERCAAAANRLTVTLATAEPLVVRDEVLRRYGVIQFVSPAFHAGSAALVLDDEARQQGSLGTLQAMALAFMRMEAHGIPPCRTEMAAALKTWLDDPANQPVDIWPARAPSDADLAGAQPVVAAVWEAGYDPSLFAGQLAIDPAEPLDGRDNDGNGVTDDWNGPTYDILARPTPLPHHPASPELSARLGLQYALEKGLLDMAYGDDSPEARFVAQRSRDADAAEQIEDVRASAEFNGWAHGTWVASLIADGAPFVRLYNVSNFLGFDHPDPLPHTEADIERWAATMPSIAARMRGAGVRIVNMSWAFAADGFARRLLQTGVETDPARAAERAETMNQVFRDAVSAVIRDCPDILFVAAAGNSDQTEQSARTTPQTLDHPNLLIVGGTGITGNPTAFSTYGAGVRLYALAEGNQVRAPGGQIMRASGTSFAAPTAVRAAAAMLAVNPELTPAELIAGLTSTARGEGDVDLPLLDAGAAVRWARARL